ncbi:peptidoglycan-binding protein [Defluviimonas sp. D31]|uniref:peptidoglycan-binding protein n=1 Tax=Defluviimonas sp. D31 TaxID=3083253 RepID=UPI0039906187
MVWILLHKLLIVLSAWGSISTPVLSCEGFELVPPLNYMGPAMYCLRQPSFLLAAIVSLLPLGSGGDLYAHSGGLNASGCHGGSQPYHCHREPSEMVRTQDGRNRLRCDLGSRSRECTGVRSTQPAVRVLNLQIQLQRHCSGLSANFADGINGPATKRALIRFQRAYGLIPDGIFGPATAQALASSPNGRC